MDYSSRHEGTISQNFTLDKMPHTEYDKPWYPDKNKNTESQKKSYLRETGNIQVNFNAGFDDEGDGDELPSTNSLIDPNNGTN